MRGNPVNALRIARADLIDPRHQAAVVRMTRAYAQENNHAALALYGSVGFAGGQYAPEAGVVLFREKTLERAGR
jgi:hypothetical protein